MAASLGAVLGLQLQLNPLLRMKGMKPGQVLLLYSGESGAALDPGSREERQEEAEPEKKPEEK